MSYVEQWAGNSIDIEYWNKVVVDNSPGKFEGEGPATAYFYEALLNGDGESIESGGFYAELFQTTPHESEEFGLDSFVLLWEDSQGFVYLKGFSSRDEAQYFWDQYNS